MFRLRTSKVEGRSYQTCKSNPDISNIQFTKPAGLMLCCLTIAPCTAQPVSSLPAHASQRRPPQGSKGVQGVTFAMNRTRIRVASSTRLEPQ